MKSSLTDDVNAQMEIFNGTFIHCVDEDAPSVTKEIRWQFAPWLNDEVCASIDERKKLLAELELDRVMLSCKKILSCNGYLRI